MNGAEQSIDHHRYKEVRMMLSRLGWFPSLQAEEEKRLGVELERRRVALERAPQSPPRPPLRARLALVLVRARPRRHRVAIVDAPDCCPA
jgi:hypothetical protein